MAWIRWRKLPNKNSLYVSEQSAKLACCIGGVSVMAHDGSSGPDHVKAAQKAVSRGTHPSL